MIVTTAAERKKWFPCNTKKSYKPYRMYCLHHAGGSVLIFRNWLKFNPLLDIIPVEIPGRGVRMEEACESDFYRLSEEIAENIAADNGDRPAVLYGHSLGAILAFRTTYILREKYHMDVRKLIVAGRHAPMDEDPVEYRSSMGMEKLKEELLRIGATPKSLLENEEFVSCMLPMIFSDYKLSENYFYNAEVVDVPIVALSGTGDQDADPAHMQNWAGATSREFSQYVFEGGHFFPYEEHERQVLECLFQEVAQCCGGAASAAWM